MCSGIRLRHTPPVPLSCMCENPVTTVEEGSVTKSRRHKDLAGLYDLLSPLSDAKPPWSSVFTSATALAMPKGRVAPGKTWPGEYWTISAGSQPKGMRDTRGFDATYRH